MATDAKQLSGREKASVLVMSLDASATAEVFDRLSPEEREVLGAEIVKLQHVDPEVRERVLAEAKRGALKSIPAPRRGRAKFLLSLITGKTQRLGRSLDLSSHDTSGHPQTTRVAGSPEDLLKLPDETIHIVLARIPAVDISLALYAASEELRDVVMRNLPPALATFVRRLLDSPEHPTISEIESARERIVSELEALGLCEEAAIG